MRNCNLMLFLMLAAAACTDVDTTSHSVLNNHTNCLELDDFNLSHDSSSDNPSDVDKKIVAKSFDVTAVSNISAPGSRSSISADESGYRTSSRLSSTGEVVTISNRTDITTLNSWKGDR